MLNDQDLLVIRAAERPAPVEAGASTQAAKAYDLIRADILSGRHEPEKQLKIRDLAAQLEVSGGAIREALSRLVPEQLVVSRTQRGFIVAPLSLADLADLTDISCQIEDIALRQSVRQGDRNWEADVLAAQHRLGSRSPAIRHDEGLRRLWAQNHAAFHHALVSACGSRRLLAFHAQLYEQFERYRGLLRFHREDGRDIDAEHQQIVGYALARDEDRLVAAVIAHYRLTRQLIVQRFSQGGAQSESGASSSAAATSASRGTSKLSST